MPADATAQEPLQAPAEVALWSLPVRAMHWLLAATVLGCLLVHEGGRAHEWMGYVALGTASLRALLGLVGPASLRFAAFLQPPAEVLRYVRQLLAGQAPRYLHHNPLGGWMVMALLGCAMLAGATGVLYTTDAFWGVEWVEELHEAFGEAFKLLVPLHLAGVALSSWLHGENLARAMWHGRKRAAQASDVLPLHIRNR